MHNICICILVLVDLNGISFSYWMKLETIIAWAFMTYIVNLNVYELHLDVNDNMNVNFFHVYILSLVFSSLNLHMYNDFTHKPSQSKPKCVCVYIYKVSRSMLWTQVVLGFSWNLHMNVFLKWFWSKIICMDKERT